MLNMHRQNSNKFRSLQIEYTTAYPLSISFDQVFYMHIKLFCNIFRPSWSGEMFLVKDDVLTQTDLGVLPTSKHDIINY